MAADTLKKAIQKARARGNAAPDNMTLFLQQIAREIIAEHAAEIQETVRASLQSEIDTFKTKTAAEARAHLLELIRANFDILRGPQGIPGKQGDGAIVDLEKIARQAAAFVTLPEIDKEEIVQKVIELMPAPDPGKQGEPGKAGSPDGPKDIANKLHAHPTPLLKMEAIIGLPKALREIQRTKKEGSDMLHGGGMTLKAGSGQTLTRNADGTWTLTPASAGVTTLTATETPNGSATVFTFAAATAKPSFIIVDNVWLRAITKAGTVNWTWNAGLKQATFTVPPVDEVLGIV